MVNLGGSIASLNSHVSHSEPPKDQLSKSLDPKMPYVSGGKGGVPRERDARDLGATHAHWPPASLPRGRERCRFGRCDAVEIQHTVF
jgi:hypothetical protein